MAKRQHNYAAGWIVQFFDVLVLRGHQFGEQSGNRLRGIKLTGFFARATRELADQVFIRIAQHVRRAIG